MPGDAPRRIAAMLVDILKAEHDVRPEIAAEACALAMADLVILELEGETDDRTIELRMRTLACMAHDRLYNWCLTRDQYRSRDKLAATYKSLEDPA